MGNVRCVCVAGRSNWFAYATRASTCAIAACEKCHPKFSGRVATCRVVLLFVSFHTIRKYFRIVIVGLCFFTSLFTATVQECFPAPNRRRRISTGFNLGLTILALFFCRISGLNAYLCAPNSILINHGRLKISTQLWYRRPHRCG